MAFKRVLSLGIIMALLATSTSCSAPAPKDTPTEPANAVTAEKAEEKPAEEKPAETAAEPAAEPATAAIAEGPDTNNGRPYNLAPKAYDSRDPKYLNGINATVLPISEKPVEITVWRGFNSTVMQGLDEGEVFKEMEKRTNVKIKFLYPPVGSETDNFNLRISSGDLPDIFSTPPAYAGGVAKAVADEVYADLTPYYDQGLMPNMKYLRENREDINRDMIDDSGRMLYFPMVDIVPSDPWSGVWVRQDWLTELGLSEPKTIDDWDVMLHKMKELKGVAPLQMNIKDWYGVKTNYMFAGSFEAGFDFLNKDGKAVFGPIEEGYGKFLELASRWYKDGVLDQDFATRTYEDYNANISAGKVGAAGLSYGEFGQIKLTGQKNDPKFDFQPVLMPTSYEGQVIKIHQDNSTVRGDREFMTTKAIDDGKAEIVAKYKDYWFSQDGGDLCSYGPEGVSYKWGADGKVEWTYPRLLEDKESDFWTLYPLFKLHNWGYLRDSTAYEFEPEVVKCIELWDTQDSSWILPDNIAFTTDEAKELATIMADINTYKEEMTMKFISGQEPIANFPNFVDSIKKMNVDRAIEINQAAIDRYNAR